MIKRQWISKDEAKKIWPERNGWISPIDELPPKSEGGSFSILVLITDGKEVTTGYYEFEYWEKDDRNNEPYIYSDQLWHSDGYLEESSGGYAKVSHWMPLPLPPKDES